MKSAAFAVYSTQLVASDRPQPVANANCRKETARRDDANETLDGEQVEMETRRDA